MIKRLPTIREIQVPFLGWEDLLEKEIATHSTILARKIPSMEETGRLQSMGSGRVGDDWATSLTNKKCWIKIFSISNMFLLCLNFKYFFPNIHCMSSYCGWGVGRSWEGARGVSRMCSFIDSGVLAHKFIAYNVCFSVHIYTSIKTPHSQAIQLYRYVCSLEKKPKGFPCWSSS